MGWIFLLGIIWLAAYHKGFRKVFFWVAGLTTAFVIFVFMVIASGPSH